MSCELAYRCASRHHERAAYHYEEAAKYELARDYEQAAHHAYLAHGHTQHAVAHAAEAAQLHADRFLHVKHCDRSEMDASVQRARIENAA
jgi:hypothetical protein